MRNIFILLTMILVGTSCVNKSQKSDLHPTKETYNNVDEYLSSFRNLVEIEGNNKNVQFIFSNKPWPKIFNENTYCCIFINNKLAFNGKIDDEIIVDMSLFSKESIHLSLIFLVLKKDGKYEVYRLSNKTKIFWEDDYRYIFTCLFPTNQNIDQVQFFPIKKDTFY
ncbi:hypothetical protein M2451_002452 [Dysgonomonas sp. PFB1-18]|uniref:hypothetical protein n=1 Tax=unclassified Dysgonomonas TaxID=2630389 RepID=UPI0024752C90|nr:MULTISPECIES: hypothetical protein [unclassified Dysgonomonas]MDH6307219.1 hypothetical protein [Dysgonomonas sp. PF1-14]MDH6337137.1 hypothetical protein [Dysgonomonas sp. PF1-16]MDH6381123.1 hypothetical protein [Dysgonomonas sp. PFB1-18]MDH6396297.1 hypothetical protein [Dysgonomonas sp. PF1-23]